VAKAFAHLSKPQAFVLAAFSLGVAEANRCTLTKVAQSLFRLGTIPAVERRLQRFLSNGRVDWKRGSVYLARWILAAAAPRRGRPLVLLVDETALNEHLKVMVVALAYRGRALPLAWWCYPQDQYPLPQVELIDALLGQVAQALPTGVPVLVQADRGLGCSPDLMAAIVRRHWHFLFRVQGSVRLNLGGGREVAFRDMVPRPGRSWSQEVRAFKKAGWISYRALGYWKVGQEEPWLLLSNWPEATTAEYALRMWEEESLRDVKSNGFNWQRSRVHQPEHANRLWLVMALAYAWVVSLGTAVLERESWWRQVAHGAKERTSVFELGMRWLKRRLHLGRKLFYGPHLNQSLLP
jgi:Transposase DDE domain